MYHILHPGFSLAIVAGASCSPLYHGPSRRVELASDFPWCVRLEQIPDCLHNSKILTPEVQEQWKGSFSQ